MAKICPDFFFELYIEFYDNVLLYSPDSEECGIACDVCTAEDEAVCSGGTGVMEGLSASASLLNSRTSIGSVKLTRLI